MKVDDFQRAPDIRGENDEDTVLLRELVKEARAYIENFSWCPGIRAIYLAYAIPGVLGLLLFKFTKKIANTDDHLWVVVGDLPSAYFVVLPQDNAQAALERYCSLMDEWVASVRKGLKGAEVFPVKADPTMEHATMLAERIKFLREEIIAQM